MNNWHIKIADCNEAQKEVLKRVYGKQFARYNYLGFDKGYIHYADLGELITPEQAFERLGLNPSTTLKAVIKTMDDKAEALGRAEQKIKNLEQQLADKPLDVDWTTVMDFHKYIVQTTKEMGSIFSCTEDHLKKHGDGLRVIATRPKPKCTPEQITLIDKLWTDYTNRPSNDTRNFMQWLKEVGND